MSEHNADTPTPHTGGDLSAAIAIGSLVGVIVLIAQPEIGLPALRVGPAPLLASAIGAVAGQVYLMAEDDSDDRLAELWDDLAQDGDQSE